MKKFLKDPVKLFGIVMVVIIILFIVKWSIYGA